MSTKKQGGSDPFAAREAGRYTQPIVSREYILNFLSQQTASLTFSELVDELQLDSQDARLALRKRLKAMVRDGQLIKNRRSGFAVASDLSLVSGKVMAHPDGYGFLIPDDGDKDLFLPFSEMRVLFHGDRALCRVAGEDSKGRLEGSVVDVLERHTHKLVGKLKCKGNVYMVSPENRRITHDILLTEKPPKKSIGQWVEVQIEQQPSRRHSPVGRVIEILGAQMDLDLATQLVIREQEIPTQWPERTLSKANRFKATIAKSTWVDREDLRQKYFVTIDGEDAKDFDDAVYCELQPNGGFKLYVAIADVSHYVKPNDSLDKEAFSRGNSVYFPHKVIPMLPESLSNGLCSLKPHEDRLAMVCQMNVSADGHIGRYRFYRAVICSHQRMTYTQVSAILDRQDPEVLFQYADTAPHLETLFKLYQTLNASRQIRGAIEFDSTETKVLLNDQQQIVQIGALQRNQAHKLIEECMLAANVSTAKFLQKHKMISLYRNHLGPSTEKLRDLRIFLKSLGLELGGGERPEPKHYAALIEQVSARPDRHLIETVLLRSLSQAKYEAENQGHFGLAYGEYAHFTSPIRRYPDLLVHRAIGHIIDGGTKENFLYSSDGMEVLGEHCSMTERRADEATWALMDWIKCQYMLDKLGEEFGGCITGVTNFGLFVELEDTFIQGLVHVTALGQDYFQFDAVHHYLLGKRTGTRYQLGDRIRVRVAAVDVESKKIDFVLPETDASLNKTSAKKRRKSAGGKKNRK